MSDASAASEWRAELRAASRLAWPLAASQLGLNLLGLVDTFFAGKIDDVTLASVSIGNAVFYGTAVLGMGVMMGLDSVASQAFGAGEDRRSREALWQGVYLALALSVPLAFLMLGVAVALPVIGVVPELADGTSEYIYGRMPSIVPWLLLTACRSYLQAAELARPVVISTIAANVINFLADGLLLFGDEALFALGLPGLGVPRLGAFGVGLASTAATLVQWGVLIAAVTMVVVPDGKRSFRRLNLEVALGVARVGVPVALQLFAEVFVFALTGVLVGRIGAEVTAAHQVALTYASLSFALCLGVGATAAVRVGRAIGARQRGGVRRAGLVTIGLAVGIMTVSALLMVGAGEFLVRLMIDDDDVVELATRLLLVAAVFQLVDGIQAVAAGALRGAGLTRVSLLANLVGHWLVGLPTGLVLAYVFDLGATGLWWGLTTGLCAVAIALSAQFWIVSSPERYPSDGCDSLYGE